MSDLLHSLSGGQVIALVSVVIGGVFVTASSLASIIAPHWRRARQVEAETQLKREMVTAGFSADEIEKVVRSASGVRPGAKAMEKVC